VECWENNFRPRYIYNEYLCNANWGLNFWKKKKIQHNNGDWINWYCWMAHLGIVYSLILQCSLYMLIVIYARIAKFIWTFLIKQINMPCRSLSCCRTWSLIMGSICCCFRIKDPDPGENLDTSSHGNCICPKCFISNLFNKVHLGDFL